MRIEILKSSLMYDVTEKMFKCLTCGLTDIKDFRRRYLDQDNLVIFGESDGINSES